MSDFDLAIQAFSDGDLATARRITENLLVKYPDDFDALLLLGAISALKNDHQSSVASFSLACRIRPTSFYAHFNLAKCLTDQGCFAEAVEASQRALGLDPASVDSACLLMNALLRSDRAEQAVSTFHTFEHACKHPSLLRALGESYLFLGRLELALNTANLALRIEPNNPLSLRLRAQIASVMPGGLSSAVSDLVTATELDPTNGFAWCELGLMQIDSGHLDAALASFDRATDLRPEVPLFWFNQGVVLGELNRPLDARVSYERALELDSRLAGAWFNLGGVLREMGLREQSLKCFDRAIELDPNNADLQYQKSLALLGLKRFSEGFLLFSSRWKAASFFKGGEPAGDQSISRSRDIGPNRLVLHAEQGIGDEVFYSRFVPELMRRFRTVTFCADRRLHGLFRRSFPGLELLDRKADGVEDVSCLASSIYIGDLGEFLGVSLESLSLYSSPYLSVADSRREQLGKSPIFQSSNRVCGLSWRSFNPATGGRKSLLPSDFEPLLDLECEFLSLQYGDVTEDIQILKGVLGARFHAVPSLDLTNDIEGLCQMIQLCDFVITTSSVTAHLAGGLGQKSAVLVSAGRGSLWYWHDDEYSCWYPSLRVFHQRIGLRFPAVLSEVVPYASTVMNRSGRG